MAGKTPREAADNLVSFLKETLSCISSQYVTAFQQSEKLFKFYYEPYALVRTRDGREYYLSVTQTFRVMPDPDLQGQFKSRTQPYNFVAFRPKKNQLNFELKLPQSDELDAKIEEAGLETLEYGKRWGLYRLRITKEDIKSKGEVLKELARTAYQRRSSL